MAKVTKTTKSVKATKPVKKPAAKPVAKAKTAATSLSVPVLGPDGKAKGRMTLSAEIFGAKPNRQLLAQAVRVYLANQRAGGASTKTRGEVEGSTRKIYRQKGTGRARHGSIRAHIFVGGGVVFGPVPHSFSMDFPAKMRRKALACALSIQLQAGHVVVVDGLETVKKTKAMAKALSSVGATANVLLVLGSETGAASLAARNIRGVSILPGGSLNAYAVLSHKKIVLMKNAVGLITV